MNLQRKINATISFMNHKENITDQKNINDQNKQNLYSLVSFLQQILKFQLEETHTSPIENPFNNEVRKQYIDMANSYLNVPGQNQGDECSLMVRYVRNYLESLDEDELYYKPRLERSMNISSPFFY